MYFLGLILGFLVGFAIGGTIMGKNQIESEKVVERKLVEYTTLNGGMCIKLLSFHLLGLPDRLCIFPKGKAVFIETKTTKQKPRQIQLFMHNKIRKLGFRVEVVDTAEKAAEIIEDVIING